MKVLIVDDSKLSATSLSRGVMRVVPDSDCQIALSGTEALEICGRDVIDVVFLDIEMPGINGLDLAKRLKVFTLSSVMIGVSIAMIFHSLYNLLVSRPGISTTIGFIMPVATAAGLFFIFSRLSDRKKDT